MLVNKLIPDLEDRKQARGWESAGEQGRKQKETERTTETLSMLRERKEGKLPREECGKDTRAFLNLP